MSKECLVEKIGATKNEMSHLWGGIFVMGGGTITFIFSELNILKWVVIILGAFFTIFFLNIYVIRKQELMNLLEKLEEGK